MKKRVFIIHGWEGTPDKIAKRRRSLVGAPDEQKSVIAARSRTSLCAKGHEPFNSHPLQY
jgi:hypothetical protein